MKVAEWIDYANAEGKPESCGGLGGWFGFESGPGSAHAHHRWSDYIAVWDEATRPYLEAIKESVQAGRPLITGAQHQQDEDGVPLFEDGTVGIFSYRGWGDLMAAIATAKDGQDHNYLEFYC